jgi:cyclomaltodextrinase / maltogenic alpha-amylase / neopullulanase
VRIRASETRAEELAPTTTTPGLGRRSVEERTPYAPLTGLPSWTRGAVVYGVVPTLFAGESPFKGVIDRLDELAELGVDALWISPVNKTNDLSAISYAVSDYFEVRPDFGTAADFKKLVQEAKRQGMRVLIDFVPNHTSNEHPFFKDAEARGRESPYYDYYDRDADGKATHYFDWEHLPNLNYEHPEVRRMMIDAFKHWMNEYGVDGFRVDAAWGIKERSPSFWKELERELGAINPDVFLLAEASAKDPFYVKNGFDAAYDWTKKLGEWAWSNVFEDPNKFGARLGKALEDANSAGNRIARFLNNNDTGERFITRYGVQNTKMAATLLLTLPGLPIVYSGDEVGAEFEPYEDPKPLAWVDRHHLTDHYKKLADLRQKLPALHSGRFARLEIEPSTSAYAFARWTKPDEAALVVLNAGDKQTVAIKPPLSLRRSLAEAELVDGLTGKKVALTPTGDGRYEIMMKKRSALLLIPAP